MSCCSDIVHQGPSPCVVEEILFPGHFPSFMTEGQLPPGEHRVDSYSTEDLNVRPPSCLVIAEKIAIADSCPVPLKEGPEDESERSRDGSTRTAGANWRGVSGTKEREEVIQIGGRNGELRKVRPPSDKCPRCSAATNLHRA